MVDVIYRSLPESLYSEVGFQMMLTDEELKAWDEVIKKDTKNNNKKESNSYDNGTPDYAKGLPSVRKICQISKDEYHRFKNHLTGLEKDFVMSEIEDFLSKKLKKKKMMIMKMKESKLRKMTKRIDKKIEKHTKISSFFKPR